MRAQAETFFKNKIALCCIGLLGLSTSSGLIQTAVSTGFSESIASLFKKFSGSVQAQPQLQKSEWGKISPIEYVGKLSKETLEYVTPFFTKSYEWLKESEKRKQLWEVVKAFNSYPFWRGVIMKSPWIILDWIYVFINGDLRAKFFSTWKYVLGVFAWVANQNMFKSHISSFAIVFAELFVFPKRAIEKFSNSSRRSGGEACQTQISSRAKQPGDIEICISVRPNT